MLTKKKAIALSIEKWTDISETGEDFASDNWWSAKRGMELKSDCALCEYDVQHKCGCDSCPYNKSFGRCFWVDTPFYLYNRALTPEARKKYAKLFLEQLIKIKEV